MSAPHYNEPMSGGPPRSHGRGCKCDQRADTGYQQNAAHIGETTAAFAPKSFTVEDFRAEFDRVNASAVPLKALRSEVSAALGLGAAILGGSKSLHPREEAMLQESADVHRRTKELCDQLAAVEKAKDDEHTMGRFLDKLCSYESSRLALGDLADYVASSLELQERADRAYQAIVDKGLIAPVFDTGSALAAAYAAKMAEEDSQISALVANWQDWLQHATRPPQVEPELGDTDDRAYQAIEDKGLIAPVGIDWGVSEEAYAELPAQLRPAAEALHTERQQLGGDYQSGQLRDAPHALRAARPPRALDGIDKLASLTEYLRAEVEEQASPEQQGALAQQVGGSHYKGLAIQPVEFSQRNNLGFCEGSVVKYICRYKSKNGVEDLLKARHYIDLLIEMEELDS